MKSNNATADRRYAEQQNLFNSIAEKHGFKVFRPDYHAKQVIATPSCFICPKMRRITAW